MESGIARILFAGTNSGCGKTTVTRAVLQALVNRELRVENHIIKALRSSGFSGLFEVP